MKTLIAKIKTELENSNWEYETCGSGWLLENDKAINYLESAKFSKKLIRETVDEISASFEGIADSLEEDELARVYAEGMSDIIAYKRIPRNFLKSWSINGDVFFKLN